jgi:predicted acetyltransferase
MIIAEFFVMRNYRRSGVGTQVAFQLFDRFPGRWEIAQRPNNIEGQTFWRRVTGDYCGGDYLEFVLDDSNWEGPVQVFDNSTYMLD